MGDRCLGTASLATAALLTLETAMAVVLATSAHLREREQWQTHERNRLLVKELGLTDPALAPGTSYSRHPSQADLFAAHSEHPAIIEHFPAGSIMPPPVIPPVGGAHRIGKGIP